MSGYTGNPDAEAQHAMDLADNGVHASRQLLIGKVLTHCSDCGEKIPEARVEFARANNMKCEFCIVCQEFHDKPNKIKMLDRIL